MSKTIIVEFSGYLEIDLDRTMFVRWDNSRDLITARQWMDIGEKDKYHVVDMKNALLLGMYRWPAATDTAKASSTA